MLEKKIYVGWADTENQYNKCLINMNICADLARKYKTTGYLLDTESPRHYDIIFEELYYKSLSTHTWRVIKNEPNLFDDELALLLDDSYLAYGYHREGDKLVIYKN